VFEVDPLVCPRCGSEMKAVSVNPDPAIIGRIVRCLEERGKEDLFEEERAPAAG